LNSRSFGSAISKTEERIGGWEGSVENKDGLVIYFLISLKTRWKHQVELDLQVGLKEDRDEIMVITHMSRKGKNYYLHTGPKRGGGIQYFFSTKSDGDLAKRVPDGFEVYENISGQVFLRRIQVKLIRGEEQDCILLGIEGNRTKRSYKIEVRGKTLTIHESTSDFDERFG
jgi:hypothetical protein